MPATETAAILADTHTMRDIAASAQGAVALYLRGTITLEVCFSELYKSWSGSGLRFSNQVTQLILWVSGNLADGEYAGEADFCAQEGFNMLRDRVLLLDECIDALEDAARLGV
jgi:hypothetical protein